MNITLEQGKTLKGVESDVLHRIGRYLHMNKCGSCYSVMMDVTAKWITCLSFSLLEVVERACGMTILQMGEFVTNVSYGIDTYSMTEPLGDCAGICPFTFHL